MLKNNEVNPLSVFGLRQLEHCPPHFTRIYFDIRTKEKDITDWIWSNLEGRFWIGDSYSKSQEQLSFQKCVAFEVAGEATVFALILDQINTYQFVV